MQDFTGVPCIVNLATMRDAVKDLGGDPEVINPQVQSDMVIDHSVQIDKYGVADAVQQNMDIEYQRNGERYQFLRWASRRSATSAWCRREPASFTRSTSNTWRRSS